MLIEIENPNDLPRYFKDVPKGEAFERPGGKIYLKTMSELDLDSSMINAICLGTGGSHRFTPTDIVLKSKFKVVRDVD